MRLELEKPDFDFKVVKAGFLRGQNHPDDINPMINAVRRFCKVPQLFFALEKWREGDVLIFHIMDLGQQLKAEMSKKNPDSENIKNWVSEIIKTDLQLNAKEKEFSFALGSASRWLEKVLMITLIFAVIIIGGTVIYLTLRFGRRLTHILDELNKTAILVGKGDLSQQVRVFSKDELGQLSKSLNQMIQSLRLQIKERKSAEHASQAKNLFLANMSHEIRTPLNAILGFSELLQDPSISENEKNRFAAIIKRTGYSLTAIINDILDLARVEAEQIEIEISHFSLNQMMSDLKAMLSLRSDEKNIQLDFMQIGEISEFISSDQTRLRQILANVIGNSIKFTTKGSVTVTYWAHEGLLCFTVEDTGDGITIEQSKQLFKPFSQGDDSIRKKYGGTGLGLMISRHLAQLLGGDIGLVESQPGRGSTFSIKIQYVPRDNIITIPSSVATSIHIKENIFQSKHILVVEDSMDNQTIVKYYLSKTGAVLEFANNGLEGLKKGLEKKYDVILMDIQMPVMDGYTATAELRKNKVMTPIVALTGFAMKEDQSKCIQAGCNEYLSKPYDRDKLIECLIKYLFNSTS